MNISIRANICTFVTETVAEAIIQHFLRNIIRSFNSRTMKDMYVFLNYLILIGKVTLLAYYFWKWTKDIFISNISDADIEMIDYSVDEGEEEEQEEESNIEEHIEEPRASDEAEISEMQDEEAKYQEEKEALILMLVGKNF